VRVGTHFVSIFVLAFFFLLFIFAQSSSMSVHLSRHFPKEKSSNQISVKRPAPHTSLHCHTRLKRLQFPPMNESQRSIIIHAAQYFDLGSFLSLFDSLAENLIDVTFF
jgi:hypothetical protein